MTSFKQSNHIKYIKTGQIKNALERNHICELYGLLLLSHRLKQTSSCAFKSSLRLWQQS